MMEFVLSKVWVFIVSAALLMVLVQGIGMKAQTERMDALEEVKRTMKDMLESMHAAGPGLDQTVEMRNVLPGSSVLTVQQGYMVLEVGGQRLSFDVPIANVCAQLMNSTVINVTSVQVQQDDTIRIVTGEDGLVITALSQRTYRTDT
jgi:hypothetical protein